VLYFFLSHTHGGVDDMAKFHADLSEHLRVLAGLKKNEEVGFFDATSLEGGDVWPPELYDKLATCGSLIALYSDSYFRSEYCGREVRVFLDRLAAYEKKYGRHARRALIPIKWTLTLTGRHPALQNFQDEDSRFGDSGEDDLWTMTTVEAHREAYDAFVKRLAEKIYRTVHECQIPSARLDVDITEIQSAFHENATEPGSGQPSREVVGRREQTSRFVHFVVAAGQRQRMNEVDRRRDTRYYGDHCLDWTPYLPYNRDPLVAHVGRVVSQRGNLGTDFVCINELIERIELASRNNQMLILLVDLWAPSLEDHRAVLATYDGYGNPEPVMIVGNIDDNDTKLNQDTLWAEMLRVLRRTNKGRYDRLYRIDCMTAEQFSSALAETIEVAQNLVLKRAGERRSGGRSTRRRPVLEGPS
jgi:FxsC-like protein